MKLRPVSGFFSLTALIFCALGIVVISVGRRGTPQDAVQSEARCPKALHDGVTFSGTAVGHTWVLASDGERTYIRPAFAPYQMGVFDERGRQLRVLGDRGQGPGEFQHIRAIVPRVDNTLLVVDQGNQRISLLDESGSVLRTTPFLVLLQDNGLFELTDSTWLVSGAVPTSDFYGYSLFRITTAGEILTSFAEAPPDERGRQTYRPVVAAVAVGGDVWSTPIHEFRVQRWSRSGELLQEFGSQRPWLVNTEDPRLPQTEDERRLLAALPPERRIVDLTMLPGSELVVLGLTADQNWSDVGDVRREGRYADYYDSIIEVWDADTGSLICDRRYDEYLVGFGDGRFVFGYAETRNGTPEIHRWALF